MIGRKRLSTRWEVTVVIMVIAGLAILLLWPRAAEGITTVSEQDDPSAIVARQLAALPADEFARRSEQEIAAALAQDDIDLAQSFAELATERGVMLDEATRKAVAEGVEREASASRQAYKFARGFITGNVEDGASLAGTVAGDLFVYGDIRDLVREGGHVAAGREADQLVMGLAAVGLAVTAGTYLTAGAAAPARAGVTLIKDARKLGRLGSGLTDWFGRSVRGVIDQPALVKALDGASVARPAQTASAIKAAFRSDRAGALIAAAKDVGRLQSKAGTRAAFDAMKIAEGPKDLARAARLAEREGSRTRALLKIFGRGALVLGMGAFNLLWWAAGLLVALFGFVASLKAFVERTTLRYSRRARGLRTTQPAVSQRLSHP